MQWVSNLLARDDLHVVAVSPAAVCALRESGSMTNPLLMPHYTVTVIYQDRITPLAFEQVDPFRHSGLGRHTPRRWHRRRGLMQ